MNRPIPSLTGLRFFAALSVAVSHGSKIILKYQVRPDWVVLMESISAIGMTLFFVLSGFVIYYNYSVTIYSRQGIRDFFVARFARIYPLYAIGIAHDLAMKYAYFALPATLAGLPYYATMTQSWFFLHIGSNTLIAQFGNVPAVAWSISTEWFFYIAFPLLALVIGSIGRLRGQLIAALILSIAGPIGFTILKLNQVTIEHLLTGPAPVSMTNPSESGFHWLMYYSPYVRIFEFALGCLCASIHRTLLGSEPSKTEQHWGLAAMLVALGGVAAMHFAMFGYQSESQWHELLLALHENFAYAPFLAVLIFCCARYKNGVVRALSNGSLNRCGEASYSLYLLHMLTILAFRWEAASVTSARVAIGPLLQLTLALASAVGLSLVTHATIEVPARRFLRRLLSSRKPVSIQK